MLPGLPPDTEWTHYVRCDLADPDSGVHDAVPARSIRDRILRCAICRQRQAYQHMVGWICSNEHCPGVDKE